VIPFVPVSGISLAQCAILARQAGFEIWSRYNIPVYFYEAAASRPDRALLEQVRQGQFEGLRELVLRDAARRPDLGGPELHPTAGASAVATGVVGLMELVVESCGVFGGRGGHLDCFDVS